MWQRNKEATLSELSLRTPWEQERAREGGRGSFTAEGTTANTDQAPTSPHTNPAHKPLADELSNPRRAEGQRVQDACDKAGPQSICRGFIEMLRGIL